MNHQLCAESDTVRIRPLKRQDIEYLRQWRNAPGLSRYLSEIPYITPDMQQAWFDRYLYDADVLFFSVVMKECDMTVGSIALYGIKDGRCEVGRIVIGEPSAHGQGIGYRALLLAIAIAVNKLGVRKVRLDVHVDNVPARRIYDKAGFQVTGSHPFARGGEELEMEIGAEEYCQANPLANQLRVYEEDSIDEKQYGQG